MPSVTLAGDPVPTDGSLPASVLPGAEERALGIYVHVPYCLVRCGYCDFNTYTAEELRGTKRADFAGQAAEELRFGARALRRAELPERPVSTVFFGGGTPTLLPAADLVMMLDTIREEWGLVPGAEVTTEANPDSVDAVYLRELAAGGFTRISFGMQSAVPSVLATLDRTHSPERVPLVTRWAREAGLEFSLDLIFGTPGETREDWERSLDVALACEPDHLSAYALIVEDGTKLAARIRRGEIEAPSDDLHADMYELADAKLAAAGYDWYEISNWSRGTQHRSRHNLSYWTGEDWWAAGPGAHSHVGGVRWWNVKHPAPYAERVNQGISPAHAREVLDEETRRVERILLGVRLADGLPLSELDAAGRTEVAGLIADGLAEGAPALRGRLVLTLRGRLLADAVVHRLLGT